MQQLLMLKWKYNQKKKEKKKIKRAWLSLFSFKVKPEEETIEIIENPKHRISPLDSYVCKVDEHSTVKITFLNKPKSHEYKTHQCKKGKGIIITSNQDIVENNNPKKPWISENRDYEQECREWKKNHDNFKQERKNIQDQHESDMADIEEDYNKLKWKREQKRKKEMKQLQTKYGKKDEEDYFIKSDDDDEENRKKRENNSDTSTLENLFKKTKKAVMN